MADDDMAAVGPVPDRTNPDGACPTCGALVRVNRWPDDVFPDSNTPMTSIGCMDEWHPLAGSRDAGVVLVDVTPEPLTGPAPDVTPDPPTAALLGVTEDDRPGLPRYITAGPNDHVLINVGNVSPSVVERIRVQLREDWPALADRVLIVAGVESVTVVKSDG